MMTLDEIAASIVALTAEHGAPNSFQLHDIAGDTIDPLACMKLARTLSMSMTMLNNRLASHNLCAAYRWRAGPCSPAMVYVEATQA